MIAPYRKLNSPISKFVQYPSSAQPQAPQSNFNPTHKSRVLRKSTVLFWVTRAVGIDVTLDTPRPYLSNAAPLTEERTPMVLTQSRLQGRLGQFKFSTVLTYSGEKNLSRCHFAGRFSKLLRLLD